MLLSLFLRLCAYCRGSRRYHRGSLGREPVNWASTMMNHSPHWSTGGVEGCVKYLYQCLPSTLFIQRLRRRDTFGASLVGCAWAPHGRTQILKPGTDCGRNRFNFTEAQMGTKSVQMLCTLTEHSRFITLFWYWTTSLKVFQPCLLE